MPVPKGILDGYELTAPAVVMEPAEAGVTVEKLDIDDGSLTAQFEKC